MTMRKSIILFFGVGMTAFLVACSSSSNTPPPPTIVVTPATGTTPQAATISNAFGTALSVTVTSNGTPAANVSVTFTAPSSGQSGVFTTSGTNTETDTTNSSGVATASAFTANTVAGTYNVTATYSGASGTFALTNNAGPAADLAIPASGAGNNQSVIITAAYAALVAQVTDGSGNGVAGVAIQFTIVPGGTGGGGSFTGGSSETVNTDTNGNATVSDLTANATAGGFTVTAAPTTVTLTPTSVTFNETNTPPAIAAGNYVYYVQGTDSGVSGCSTACPSPYFLAGVFTVSNSGAITNAEQDFSDFNYDVSAEQFTSGSVAATADGNLLITLNTGDVNIGAAGSGTLVLNASMASATRGLLSEYDSWATGVGELNFQPSVPTTACAVTPCGFAFEIAGLDANGGNISVGGVTVIDSAGGISGTGSAFDVNDVCASVNSGLCVPGVFSNQAFSTSTVQGPDGFGLVTFTMNSGLFTSSPGVVLDGYMIDSSHIRLIEFWLNPSTLLCNDAVCSSTGGTALGQTSVGGFGGSSLSGSTYVASLSGTDINGVLQGAGAFAFNSGGTVGGVISYNDITLQNAQGGTAVTGGTWSVDATGTGRATLTGVTDGTVTLDMQLYLTGDGHATIISMDAANPNEDVLNGLSWQQASGLGVSTPSGNYALAMDEFSSGFEFNGDGVASFDSATTTITGFLDSNGTLIGNGLQADTSFGATYTGTSTNGVLDITGTGSSASLLTYYLIDATQGVLIENDNSQLTLGYATNQ